MTIDLSSADAEFQAMHQVYGALSALDEEAQSRVVAYVCSRLGIMMSWTSKPPVKGPTVEHNDASDDDRTFTENEDDILAHADFEHLAELFDATDPNTESDKALIAAYWLQMNSETDSVDGFTINKELKHLGQGLSNVTRAIDALKNQKPALMMQLRKSGKSKQSRKTYKVTHAGEKAVKDMING